MLLDANGSHPAKGSGAPRLPIGTISIVGFFNQVGGQRGVRLLAIPGTAVGRPELRHNRDEVFKGVVHALVCLRLVARRVFPERVQDLPPELLEVPQSRLQDLQHPAVVHARILVDEDVAEGLQSAWSTASRYIVWMCRKSSKAALVRRASE